jgi:hypothetical protein
VNYGTTLRWDWISRLDEIEAWPDDHHPDGRPPALAFDAAREWLAGKPGWPQCEWPKGGICSAGGNIEVEWVVGRWCVSASWGPTGQKPEAVHADTGVVYRPLTTAAHDTISFMRDLAHCP